MWIESIYIRGFGCLVDKRFEFPPDRAALIVADNESGKSTLASAIFAALCGFPNKRRAKDKIIPIDAYRPWKCDTYAVEMDILVDQKRIRVERDFARDTFVVRDRDTGKDIKERYDKDLAAHILHLPLDDFRRIAFVCGKDSPSLGPADGIQARLSSLIEGSDKDACAESAISALESVKYTFGNSGPIKIDNAIKRIVESIESKRKAINALEAAQDAAGDDARRLEIAKAQQSLHKEQIALLDSEFDKSIVAERRSSAADIEKIKIESAIGQAEAKLSAIDSRRSSGKSLGSTVTFVGLMIALVSFGLWIAQILPTMPSVIGTLIGIGVVSVGAVHASKSRWIDSDEKIRLQREIDEIRARVQISNCPLKAAAGMRSSSDIDGERRQLRAKLDDINSNIIELEKRVGAAVDEYKARYSILREELRSLERERAKAERFAKAIAIAINTLGEVSKDSRKRWASALNASASTILPRLNPDYDSLRFDDNLEFTIRHIPTERTLENLDINTCLSTGAKDQVYLAARLACCEELSRAGEPIPVLLDDPFMAADDCRFAEGLRYIAKDFAKKHQVIILSCARDRHECLAQEAWFDKNLINICLD